MKKALSIILVLVMMFTLIPTVLAEGEGDYHITIYAGDTKWQVTTAYEDSNVSDVVRDNATNPHWNYIPSSGTISILSNDVTEVDISPDVGKNISLSFAAIPKNCFTVKNGSDNLTIKPAASMPSGLRIIKTADKTVTIQFDGNTEIGNGLFIQPDGTISFTSKDVLISNGSTVRITLDTASDDSTFNSTVAAVNTSWPIELAKSGPSFAVFNFTTDSSKATSNNIVTGAVATRNSNNSAMLTVNSGVNLNAKINLSNSETLCSAVYADRIEIQSGATVNAGFNEKINEGTNYAIWCLNDFSNYGFLIALTKSGTDNEAARFKDVNFCGGEMEVEAPKTSNAMAIEGTMTITAPLVKAIAGDSKDTAVEIANPGEKTIYNGKNYIKIEALNNSVSLKQSAISLGIGETSTLNAETVPDTATIISWDTDSDAVTLDKKGYSCSVTAVKVGKATITVTDSNRNTDSCEVIVTPYVPPTKLNITDPVSSCTFTAAGGEHWFIASLLPEDSDKSGYTIDWVTSNPNVAKVADIKENGTTARIVSVAAGTCDITARCEALGLSSVRTVSVMSDFRFTSNNKLVFYYDNRSKIDCNFATTIPSDMVNKVTVNGNTMTCYKDSKGNLSIPYSSLLNTFGTKSARMPLRVYYGEGSNQYIEKTLYYMSIYDAPLTADTDMTWTYVTMLVSGLFISASPWVAKRVKRRGASQ